MPLQGNLDVPGKPTGTVGQSVEGIWQVHGSAGTEMPPTNSSPGCPSPGCVAVYAGHLPVHAPPSYRPQHCLLRLALTAFLLILGLRCHMAGPQAVSHPGGSPRRRGRQQVAAAGPRANQVLSLSSPEASCTAQLGRMSGVPCKLAVLQVAG